MSTEITVGELLTGKEKRDAIHFALAPVVAGHTISPGQRIGFQSGDHTTAFVAGTNGVNGVNGALGIADPFYNSDFRKGQRFWMFLFPNTVTGMTHSWQHPSFPDSDTQSEKDGCPIAEKWLREFGDSIDCDYDKLMRGAAAYVDSVRRGGFGEYINEGPRYESVDVPDEFWFYYEVITGDKVIEKHRGHFFSCAC